MIRFRQTCTAAELVELGFLGESEKGGRVSVLSVGDAVVTKMSKGRRNKIARLEGKGYQASAALWWAKQCQPTLVSEWSRDMEGDD